MFQSIRKLRTQDLRAAVASESNGSRKPSFDSRILDTLLLQNKEPQLGAHVLWHRRRYSHHGIYVGDGRVVHYAGYVSGFATGPVEEVSLAEFAHNRPIWIRRTPHPLFPAEEAVRRARMRVGENRYQLLRNNCEHFCEWCLYGEPRSFQIECLSHFERVLVVMILAAAALVHHRWRLKIRNAPLLKSAYARAWRNTIHMDSPRCSNGDSAAAGTASATHRIRPPTFSMGCAAQIVRGVSP